VGTSQGHPRREVEEAWREFRRLGAEEERWEAWADLFTEDAHYQEHNLGTFTDVGRSRSGSWTSWRTIRP